MEPLEPMTIRGPTIGVQLLAPVVARPLLLVLFSSAEEALYSMISKQVGVGQVGPFRPHALVSHSDVVDHWLQ
jgi:hypothetical protein